MPLASFSLSRGDPRQSNHPAIERPISQNRLFRPHRATSPPKTRPTPLLCLQDQIGARALRSTYQRYGQKCSSSSTGKTCHAPHHTNNKESRELPKCTDTSLQARNQRSLKFVSTSSRQRSLLVNESPLCEIMPATFQHPGSSLRSVHGDVRG